MDVDIYIKETQGNRELRIPWLPDKISYDGKGTRMAKYEIIDVGDVEVPTGSELEEISWSSSFPGAGHKDLPFIRGKWQNPKNIQNLIDDWKAKGTPLRVIITGTPINHDVYIADFVSEYESGYGDYKYDITLKRRREIKIITTKVSVSRPSSGGSSGGGSSGGSTYTVKSGDTLWGIAQKYYGSGAKYGTIYNANKTIIEQTAKKHGKSSSNGGHWIYPGTTLQIP